MMVLRLRRSILGWLGGCFVPCRSTRHGRVAIPRFATLLLSSHQTSDLRLRSNDGFFSVLCVRHGCPRHCASLKLISRQPRATRMTAANTCFRKRTTYPVTQPHHGWYLASNLLSRCQKTFNSDVQALPCRRFYQISVLSASCI